MECTPVDYYLKFMHWFKQSYPQVEEKYSSSVILHVNKPAITIRVANFEEHTIKLLNGIIEEFKREFG